MIYRIIGTVSAFCLASSLAVAQNKPDETTFTLKPNPAFLACLSGGSTAPKATVHVKRGELNDTALIRVTGLKPNLQFDLFTVQRSPLDSGGAPVAGFKGFGLAWYQSDLSADGDGNAKVVIKTILLDQIFGFDADAAPTQVAGPATVTTVLKPTNTFHMGFWFNNPDDAAPCGFDVSKPTPFNGQHRAGPLAMISLPVEPQNLGPLCTSPTNTSTADDSGSDPSNSTIFACNP